MNRFLCLANGCDGSTTARLRDAFYCRCNYWFRSGRARLQRNQRAHPDHHRLVAVEYSTIVSVHIHLLQSAVPRPLARQPVNGSTVRFTILKINRNFTTRYSLHYFTTRTINHSSNNCLLRVYCPSTYARHCILKPTIILVGSWFVSPILAGLVSTSIFYICKYTVLSKV